MTEIASNVASRCNDDGNGCRRRRRHVGQGVYIVVERGGSLVYPGITRIYRLSGDRITVRYAAGN